MSLTLSDSSFGALTQEKRELIRSTICKDATDAELQLFFHACERTKLDPLMRQIYFVKRGGKGTIQTGIDGYRLIADRTKRYAPGQESTYTYDTGGKLISSTSYVKKRTEDGTWHVVSATAFLSEYKPSYSSDFWTNKPHIMLAKCAEGLALRKAFPAELSGIYVKEELDQGVVPEEDLIAVSINEEEKPIVSIIPREDLIKSIIEKTRIVDDQFKEYLQYLESKCIGKIPSFYDVLKMSVEDPSRMIMRFNEWKYSKCLKKEVVIQSQLVA